MKYTALNKELASLEKHLTAKVDNSLKAKNKVVKKTKSAKIAPPPTDISNDISKETSTVTSSTTETVEME